MKWSLPIPHSPEPLAVPICIVCMDLSHLNISYKWNHTKENHTIIRLCVWLLWLSVSSLYVAYMHISISSFLWLNKIPLYVHSKNFFTNSATDAYLDCVHLWLFWRFFGFFLLFWIVLHICLSEYLFSILLGRNLEVELWGRG